MSEMDLELADMLRVCRENPPPCNYSLLLLGGHLNASGGGGGLYGLNFPGDGAPWLRILVSLVYFLVATAGMAGNLLVMFLLYSTRTVTSGTINFFVFNLALAQLLFSLALPFWAAEMALDYSWPFDVATCKAISLLTGLNVYASCFFLTAMSLTRYCSVATALRPATGAAAAAAALWHRGSRCSLVAAAAIWAGALVAASPRGVFADLFRVGAGNDTVCLFRFPDGTAWLGVNHLLRVVLGFLLPYAVIVLSYLLLLRFLCRHNKMSGVLRARRKSHVSRSVAVVVLSFCACWFPYNLLTLWGVLIQLDVVDISPSFYLAQTYFFPLANCLAFTSSCLNPVIYCLVRREYRTALRSLLLRCGLAAASKVCPYRRIGDNGGGRGGPTAAGRPLGIPLNNMDSQTVQSDTRRDAATPSYTVVVSSP